MSSKSILIVFRHSVVKLNSRLYLLVSDKHLLLNLKISNGGVTHSTKKLLPETCTGARDQNRAVWLVGCVWKFQKLAPNRAVF